MSEKDDYALHNIPAQELQAVVESWRDAADSASEMSQQPHTNTSLFIGVRATREDCADRLERLIESSVSDDE